ncbi:polysaccharide deacetylase family protein [Salibaculum sp.]|uniref:polysaccharide deacetylase family protein n=1 Tax=Salibaculum sp. TaxID=2855480 RepID=UPI002B4A4343|nr:polysaccharide deacetylase family protein [Salibaculum sp.]HKL69594.1 polysaccharide deacetylase family protein [Salibaculum sp.]
MKAIMYHYVRDYDAARPHFRFLDIANFRRQLDMFAREYGFVTRAEWDAFVTLGEMPRTPGKIILTFDDAMSCHYTHVFPELRARGLWGMFYVSTQPYEQGRMLDVHKVHLLCGTVSGPDLFDRARAMVDESMIPHARRDAFREATYTTQHNAPGVTEAKRLLNYFLDEAHRGDVIDALRAEFGLTFDCDAFYVRPEHLRQMQAGGMMIGGHTVRHPVMSKLDPAAQGREITDCLECLDAVCSPPVRSYAHPYGGFHSFDAATLAALGDNDVAFAFNVEPRDITDLDHQSARHFLPRHDCNSFRHGAAS